MSKVQEYLKRKKIQELGLPKLYIVKSTPKGVEKSIECQVVEILELNGVNRYKIEDSFPYEVDILRGETSNIQHGYGSGFGDLWGWTYFSSLSLTEAEVYYLNELERVKEKYEILS